MSACAACGFDTSSVTPPDAIVALRSLPRRFGAVAAPPAGEGVPAGGEDLEVDERRRTAVLAEAGRAAAAIDEIGADLRSVLVQDTPTVASRTDVATADRDGGDPATALERLAGATTSLATLAEGQPARAWTRAGNRPTGPVSAADLLREAVHAGVHRLRAAEHLAGRGPAGR